MIVLKSAAFIFSEVFPNEVFLEITKYADFDTSKILLSVSKVMNNVISSQNEARRKLVNGMAFGKEEWLKFYDLDIGKEPLLPRDIVEILNSPCHMDPTRSLRDTHILTLIPKGLTIKSFGEHAKKYFLASIVYNCAYQPIHDALETPNDKSYWVLMSKNVLNGSKGHSFKKQQEMVFKLSQNTNVNCEFPIALEAAVSILTHQIRSEELLFSGYLGSHICCLEEFSNYQLVFGGLGFAQPSLFVRNYNYDYEFIGVAVLRKFRPLIIG